MNPGRQRRLHRLPIEARVRQIQLAAALVRRIGRFSAGKRLLQFSRRFEICRTAGNAILGYRRLFPSLADAQAALAPFAFEGHEGPETAKMHLELSKVPRESDYAALFHLAPLMSQTRFIYDLGGNVANLYYCYAKYLQFRPDMVWRVLDLPENMARGAALARERGVQQIQFSKSWAEASGADILIASGSIHYFQTPLPKMIEELEHKPQYVLINRTPLTDQITAATNQDYRYSRVACILYNKADLIRDLEAIGYAQVDSWPAHELSLEVPGHPEYTVAAYTGALFKAQAHQREHEALHKAEAEG